MRKNISLSSQELNDKFLIAYEYLVYLLGQELLNQEKCSGLYEQLETSCTNMIISPSGIPSIFSNQTTDILKFDYIYRKNFNQIRSN